MTNFSLIDVSTISFGFWWHITVGLAQRISQLIVDRISQPSTSVGNQPLAFKITFENPSYRQHEKSNFPKNSNPRV
jgi:hypothetical protein